MTLKAFAQRVEGTPYLGRWLRPDLASNISLSTEEVAELEALRAILVLPRVEATEQWPFERMVNGGWARRTTRGHYVATAAGKCWARGNP
jgi:hypothetical protein